MSTTRVPVRETGHSGCAELRTPRSPGEIEFVRGWPVESVARALLQIAALGSPTELLTAWRQADFFGLLWEEQIRAVARRGVPGSALLRATLSTHPPRSRGDRFRSQPEYLLLDALLEAGAPRPLVNSNVEVGGRFPELDFFFPEAQLNVEVDGPQHLLPTRRREDEERDAFLRQHGVAVMRFSEQSVAADAAACAAAANRRRLERIAELAA